MDESCIDVQFVRGQELQLSKDDTYFIVHEYSRHNVIVISRRYVFESGSVMYYEQCEIVGLSSSSSWTKSDVLNIAERLSELGYPSYERPDKSFFQRLFE